jgi:hypothetical protein
MPGLPQLPAAETLFRRLDPTVGLWDRERRHANALAFQDPGRGYPDLSLSIASRLKSPAAFLESFGRFAEVRRVCGTGDRSPTAREMLAVGYGVAVVTAGDVSDLQLDFKRDAAGNIEIGSRGHVNVVRGHEEAAEFALRAYVLTDAEVLSLRETS